MGTKSRSKRRLGLNDQKIIDEKIKAGWNKHKIALHIGCSYNQVQSYLSQKSEEYEDELPVKIRRLLKEHDNFGKLNEDTQEYIVELYRENIPSKIIADLIGLEYSPNLITSESGGFTEKKEITFKDKCKQAQAEPKIKLIMAAATDPKPNDALRLLIADGSTRDMYRAPKSEQKGTVKIEFPGFSRETDVSVPVESEDIPEKLN